MQTVLRSGLAAIIMGALVLLWLQLLSLWQVDNAWVAALGGMVIAVIVYGLASFLVKSAEVGPVLAIILGRLRRNRINLTED